MDVLPSVGFIALAMINLSTKFEVSLPTTKI